MSKEHNNNNKIEITILWKQQVKTDRTIPNNKQDVTVRVNEKETCQLISTAIQGDRNMIMTGTGSILKRKDLTIEVPPTWSIKN
jgi:hypothetical protein